MNTSTRDTLIACGARLIHRQGFHNTGIQEILAAAGVPKGSFYHFFKSKEEFGLAVIDHLSAKLLDRAEAVLAPGQGSPMTRLRTLFGMIQARFKEEGCGPGCPLGNLVQEMAPANEAFAKRLDAGMQALIARYARILAEARDQGEIAPDIDPDAAARFLFAAWQGTILQLKAAGGLEPIDTFNRFVFQVLLARPGQA